MTKRTLKLQGLFIVWKQNRKQNKKNKNKRTTYQKQNQHKTERQKHKAWNRNKNRRKMKQPKIKATWVSKRRCWEKLFQRNKQTLTKETATKKNWRNKKKKRYFPKRGWWTKTKEKMWNLEREDKRKTRKKQNKKGILFLKTNLLGEQNRKNSKTAKNLPYWAFQTKKNKNTEEKQNHQKTNKKTPFCMLANNLPFLVNLYFFSTCTLLFLQRCVVTFPRRPLSPLKTQIVFFEPSLWQNMRL